MGGRKVNPMKFKIKLIEALSEHGFSPLPVDSYLNLIPSELGLDESNRSDNIMGRSVHDSGFVFVVPKNGDPNIGDAVLVDSIGTIISRVDVTESTDEVTYATELHVYSNGVNTSKIKGKLAMYSKLFPNEDLSEITALIEPEIISKEDLSKLAESFKDKVPGSIFEEDSVKYMELPNDIIPELEEDQPEDEELLNLLAQLDSSIEFIEHKVNELALEVGAIIDNDPRLGTYSTPTPSKSQYGSILTALSRCPMEGTLDE